MKNLILILTAAMILSGCVAYATPGGVAVEGPDVVAIGFYDPAFGFWTGTGWDRYYYDRGHPGYGHPRYHGGRYVHTGHHR
jgi:hypothetical protein